MAAKKKSSTKKTGKSGAKTAKKAPTSKKKATAKKAAPAKNKAALAKKAAPAKKTAKAPVKQKAAAKRAPAEKAAAPQKAAAKKTSPAPKKAAASNAPTSRRDATGHLNPEYAKKLREASNEFRDNDDDTAFFRKSRTNDSLAEELGEDVVSTMTSGEDQSEHFQDAEVEEENGGPFITTSPREEYAIGTDASNPSDATREPFPKT